MRLRDGAGIDALGGVEGAPQRIGLMVADGCVGGRDFQQAIETSATGAPPDVAARLFEARIPLGRHACPEEIARSVLYLASADSSFVTGSTHVVDGGMHI